MIRKKIFGKEDGKPSIKSAARIAGVVAAVLLILLFVFGTFYNVSEQQNAVYSATLPFAMKKRHQTMQTLRQ